MNRFEGRIHRGAHQIGGSCVELRCGPSRLVLDVGLPLVRVPYRELLPDVPGLWASGDASLLGVVLSHVHPDHCGLADLVSDTVPVYCGARGSAVLAAAAPFVPSSRTFRSTPLRDHVTQRIGPFGVTPIPVDHSAHGSHGFLIEAAGRTLLYTGDFRASDVADRRAATFARIARGVDVALIEGTRITGDRPDLGEVDVAARVAELLRRRRGLGLLFFSPQNVGRLTALHAAARASGRTFVMDLYTAAVALAVGDASSPKPAWEDVRVYLPRAQRRSVIERQDFDVVDAVRRDRVFIEQLEARPSDYAIVCRASMLPELWGCLDGAQAVWSMWSGYLETDANRRLVTSLRKHGVGMETVHASGHASRDVLRRFGETLDPGVVIPIHTQNAATYAQLFKAVRIHSDGTWWNV